MATLKAIVGATTYTLTGGTVTYRLVMQGIGMAPVRNLTQRGPLQDGVTVNGYRLDPRTIRLALFFKATDAGDADDRRATIYEIFRPRADLITLEETLDNGDVRRIDGRVTGAMDLPLTPQQERIGTSQIFSVDFFCPDPTWYDPTVDSTTFDATDNVDWWLALGTIDSGEVEEYVENPTQTQSVDNAVSVADGATWTIYIRTNITDIAPVSTETVFQLYNASAFGASGAISSVGNGFTVRNTSNTVASLSGAFATGQHDYMVISTGSLVEVFRDGVSLGTFGAGTIRGIDGNNAFSSWRGGAGTGTVWTPTIPNGAIYNVALDSTQRAALISAADGAYDVSKTIANDGSYAALPIVYLVGPIEDPILTNVTTGEVLDLTGITIASGDTYIIDCRYGYKTVKNAAGTNKIADLTAASDLATFHLEPGDNAFTLAGTSTDANTQVTINFYPRYVGL